MYKVNYHLLSPLQFLARSVDVFPAKTAVIYGERRYTYAEFNDRVWRLARALHAAGVSEGDRVAVLAPNIPASLEAMFGIPALGALLVAINTRLAPGEIRFILEHSGARVLLVDSELAPPIAAAVQGLPGLQVVSIVDPASGVTQTLPGPEYEAWLAAAPPADLALPIGDERAPIAINYTSGTTGNPKGVLYTHRGASINALAEIAELGYHSGSVYLWTLPMFHCNGWCMGWALVAAGGTQVCLRKPDPAVMLDLLRRHGVTHFCGAPIVLTSFAAYLESQGIHRLDQPLHIVTAAAPPSPRIIRTIDGLGIKLTHVYGLTETYGPFTICEWHREWDGESTEVRARLKARQGVPYLGLGELAVLDPAGPPGPPGRATKGEVALRGNRVMAGYYANPAATDKAFAGGWFHSGDLGVWHADGYIELKDRAKDIIISGGENISTQEVEKAIMEHPAVLEVAVVGIPDEQWGERPKAFVGLKPGAMVEAEEIIGFCRERLAHYKCPNRVEFCELPKTSTGKIQKYVLREKEWGGREKRIN